MIVRRMLGPPPLECELDGVDDRFSGVDSLPPFFAGVNASAGAAHANVAYASVAKPSATAGTDEMARLSFFDLVIEGTPG